MAAITSSFTGSVRTRSARSTRRMVPQNGFIPLTRSRSSSFATSPTNRNNGSQPASDRPLLWMQISAPPSALSMDLVTPAAARVPGRSILCHVNAAAEGDGSCTLIVAWISPCQSMEMHDVQPMAVPTPVSTRLTTWRTWRGPIVAIPHSERRKHPDQVPPSPGEPVRCF